MGGWALDCPGEWWSGIWGCGLAVNTAVLGEQQNSMNFKVFYNHNNSMICFPGSWPRMVVVIVAVEGIFYLSLEA